MSYVRNSSVKYFPGYKCCAFSPDGTKFASALFNFLSGEPGDIKIYDVKKGKMLYRLIGGHEDMISAIDWHGEKIISGSSDGKVIMWDIRPFYNLYSQEANSAGMSPEEKAENEVKMQSKNILNTDSEPIEIRFSKDGSKVLVVSRHGILTLLDPTTGEIVAKYEDDYSVSVHSACFSPDGKDLAISTSSGIRLLNLESHQNKWSIPDLFEKIDWETDKLAASYDKEGSFGVSCLNPLDGSKMSDYKTYGSVESLKISPDGISLAAGQFYHFQLIDLSRGEMYLSRPSNDKVVGVTFSPNSLMVTRASLDNNIMLMEDTYKREKIIDEAVEKIIEFKNSPEFQRYTMSVNESSYKFSWTNRIRVMIMDLREKLNGYFFPHEIEKYSSKLDFGAALPVGLTKEFMENDHEAPVSINYTQENLVSLDYARKAIDLMKQEQLAREEQSEGKKQSSSPREERRTKRQRRYLRNVALRF